MVYMCECVCMCGKCICAGCVLHVCACVRVHVCGVCACVCVHVCGVCVHVHAVCVTMCARVYGVSMCVCVCARPTQGPAHSENKQEVPQMKLTDAPRPSRLICACPGLHPHKPHISQPHILCHRTECLPQPPPSPRFLLLWPWGPARPVRPVPPASLPTLASCRPPG